MGVFALRAGSRAGGAGVFGERVGRDFDRIREAFRRYRKMSTHEVIDHAITSTMSRTIITHASTEAMVLSMLFLAAPASTISPWH